MYRWMWVSITELSTGLGGSEGKARNFIKYKENQKFKYQDVVLHPYGVTQPFSLHCRLPLDLCVCERSARPVVESANHQHHFMSVVPLWWFLSGFFWTFQTPSPACPSLYSPLDFTFARGLCKMLSLVSSVPWMSFTSPHHSQDAI